MLGDSLFFCELQFLVEVGDAGGGMFSLTERHQ